MRTVWKRRGWLSAALCLLPLCAPAAPKVATSDWAVAETLVAMRHPPVTVGDKKAYENWVVAPRLPENTLDMGLRMQPNLELLRAQKPDMFINSVWFQQFEPQFNTVAPSHTVNFFQDNGIDWQQTLAATREVGRYLGDAAGAERLIGQTDRRFAALRGQLQPYRQRPLAVIQFIDARHARIFGRNSLYDVVLQRLDLRNAWAGQTNAWGFNNIDLTALAGLPENTLLLVVQPYPAHVPRTLQKSALWQRLPYCRAENMRVLPPVWSFGALPSMQRFGDELAVALKQERGQW